MKFWYFRFEGVFTLKSQHSGDGVFSACLLPESNFPRARGQFLKALLDQGIELREVVEHFPVDGDELDPEDESNRFWIE